MSPEIDQSPEPEELYRLGLEAFRRGEQLESRRLNEQALRIARVQKDQINEIRALIGLCRVAFREGDHDEIERLTDDCLPIWETLPDKTLVTSPFHMLAESHRLHGRFDEARQLYLRNIEQARALNDSEMIDIETINLALLEVAAGNHEEAMEHIRRLAGQGEVQDPYLLLARGAARVASGDHHEGVADLVASSRLLEEEGQILDPADQRVYDAAMERARGLRG